MHRAIINMIKKSKKSKPPRPDSKDWIAYDLLSKSDLPLGIKKVEIHIPPKK